VNSGRGVVTELHCYELHPTGQNEFDMDRSSDRLVRADLEKKRCGSLAGVEPASGARFHVLVTVMNGRRTPGGIPQPKFGAPVLPFHYSDFDTEASKSNPYVSAVSVSVTQVGPGSPG
jgi:hypothetical protein